MVFFGCWSLFYILWFFGVSTMNDEEFFASQGYTDIKKWEKYGWCAINRYIFTVGFLIGMDRTGMKGRFCFDTMANAKLFAENWDGETFPVAGLDGCTAIKI